MFQEEATEISDLLDVGDKKERVRDAAKISDPGDRKKDVSLTGIGVCRGEVGFLLS